MQALTRTPAGTTSARGGLARRGGLLALALPRAASAPLRTAATPSSAAAPAPAPARSCIAASAVRSIAYTSHEGNSWEVTFQPSGATVLMDPWLVGDLTFLDAAWLYRGRKRGLPLPVDLAAVCARTDVIILSQALPDHAHGPTLRALPDKAIPVLCSPAAEGAARAAGFTDVTALPHGASATVAGGRLRVTATAGALVGPPWSQRENGFVIEQQAGGGGDGGGGAAAGSGAPLRLYYEPHCDAGPGALDGLAPVDVVITPAVSQRIAGFPLVMGDENAVGLCRALRPAALVPLVNAEFTQEGPLAAVIQEVGKGPVDLQARLKGAGLGTRVVAPGRPGEAVVVEV